MNFEALKVAVSFGFFHLYNENNNQLYKLYPPSHGDRYE